MAWITWQGERAYLRHRDASGRVKTKSLGKVSKIEAQALKTAYELRGNAAAPIAGPAFSALVARYIDWHKWEYPASHKRIRQIIEAYLVPFFTVTPIGLLTLEQAEQYKLERMQQAAPATVQKEVRTLKAILNKAIEWDMLGRNPLAALRPPKVLESDSPPYYTIDQLNQLYAASSDEHGAVWRLAANTGLRRSELMNLRVDDLRDNGIHVVSRAGKRTKSGKWRLVPYTAGSCQGIHLLIAKASGINLLPTQHKDSISRAFKVCAKRAGVGGSLHWLRHTYASHLIMQGIPVRAVQQVMGHSTIAVTEKYAHLSEDYVDQRIGGLML